MPNDQPEHVVTRKRLIRDLEQLGVRPGQVVMFHSSVKAVGWVVGGPDTVLQAVIDVLMEKGTLMMLAGWEDRPYHLPEWPLEKQEAYLEECPAFNPVTSRANRNWSILNEYLRTRSGAFRSDHPELSVAAIGHLAKWITENHPLQYGCGKRSPLAKLCEVNGKVLMLGAPFDTITLLHHAECLADVKNKRVVHYKMPVVRKGKRVWIEFEEYDTSHGIVDWSGRDYFSTIGKEYVLSGKCAAGKIGLAQSYLFDAKDLVWFAVRWMEEKFNNLLR